MYTFRKLHDTRIPIIRRRKHINNLNVSRGNKVHNNACNIGKENCKRRISAYN